MVELQLPIEKRAEIAFKAAVAKPLIAHLLGSTHLHLAQPQGRRIVSQHDEWIFKTAKVEVRLCMAEFGRRLLFGDQSLFCFTCADYLRM